MTYTHPIEMATIVTGLYSGHMRSKELVKEIVVDVLIEEMSDRLPIGWRSAYR